MSPFSIQSFSRWIAIGFLSGILIHAGAPLTHLTVWIPISVFAGSFLFRNKVVLAAALAFALGFYRFEMTLPRPDDALMKHAGETMNLTGRIRDIGRYDATLDVHSLNVDAMKNAGRISFQSGTRSLRVGDEVRVTCRLELIEPPEERMDLREPRNGIFMKCHGASDIMRLHAPHSHDVIANLARWRELVSKRIRMILPGDEGALLSGILYGERSLSAETTAAFRHAGMTHLIAVSGSNITIVVSLFVPVLIALGYRRRSAIFLSGFGIFLFTVFVGAGASVIRAALMGWAALLARYFGRKAHAAHLLLLAGTIMIMFDPWALAFDAGFALSFLATWGLIAWSPMIAERLTWIPEAFGLREIIATTMAATISTIPYLLWAFEGTSLAGIVTNVFAIPLVALAMAWGAIAVMFGMWIPWVALPASGCLKAMLGIAWFSERFPWLQVSIGMPTWGLFLSYVVMIVFWRRCLAKKMIYPQFDVITNDFERLSKAFVRPF